MDLGQTFTTKQRGEKSLNNYLILLWCWESPFYLKIMWPALWSLRGSTLRVGKWEHAFKHSVFFPESQSNPNSINFLCSAHPFESEINIREMRCRWTGKKGPAASCFRHRIHFPLSPWLQYYQQYLHCIVYTSIKHSLIMFSLIKGTSLSGSHSTTAESLLIKVLTIN